MYFFIMFVCCLEKLRYICVFLYLWKVFYLLHHPNIKRHFHLKRTDYMTLYVTSGDMLMLKKSVSMAFETHRYVDKSKKLW